MPKDGKSCPCASQGDWLFRNGIGFIGVSAALILWGGPKETLVLPEMLLVIVTWEKSAIQSMVGFSFR